MTRRLKPVSLIAVLAGFGASAPATAPAGPPRFVYAGDAHFAPYDFLDAEGRPSGFNVELVRALARDAGVEVDVRLGAWDRARADLDAGTADLISLSHSEEREKAYLWLVQTWTMHQCVLFPAGRAGYPHSPADLAAETIAVQERSAVEEMLFALPAPRPALITVETQGEALRLLQSRVASGAGGNSLTLRMAAAQTGTYNLVEMPLRAVPYGLMAKKGREADLAWVARSMARVREAGTVEALAERFLAVPAPKRTWRDYSGLFSSLVAILCAVSAGAFVWTRSLRREVRLRTRELEAALGQKEQAEEGLIARGRALRESEERFERLSAAAFEGIAITEQGVFVDGNQQLATMLGVEVAGLVGREASEFVAPEHRELVASIIKSSSEIPYSHLARRKDGSIFTVEVQAKTMPYKGRTARVTALRDITEKVRAEEALRGSEKRYRDIFDFSPIGIYQSRPDGTLITANLAFAQLLGYGSVEEVLGLDMSRDVYFDPDQRARLIERYEGAGHATRVELLLKRKDGTPFWAEMAAHALKDTMAGTLYFEGFLQDISARRAAEEALRASEERYRLLFDGNPLPMFVSDLETLRLLAVNEAAVRQYGYSREELLSLSIPDFAVPGEELDRYLATRHEQRPDLVHVGLRQQRRKDGSIIDIDLTSLAIPFAGRKARMALARDVTGERQAEAERELLKAAIERAGAEWQRTVDALDTCVLILDLEGRLKRCNRASRDLLGRDYPDVLERRIQDLGPGGPWRAAGDLVEAARTNSAPAAAQAQDRARGMTWDLVAYSMPASAGGEERIILVVRDISRVVALQESLRHSETMSTMGSLVAGVAHEVRNPLFSISATVDALESDLEGRQEYVEYTNLLRSQVARLTQLMRDLLDYGKPPALRRATVHPREILKRAIRTCGALAREQGVALAEEVAPDLGPVFLDASRVEQVFENLVANAIQNSPRGGTVRVGVGRSQGPKEAVEIRVEDEGTGLAAGDIPHLFEPFFSRRKGGTGLGLSVVQRIVEAHGGQVSAANRASGGAVFTVRLPANPVEESAVRLG